MRLCYKQTDAMLYLFWHQTPFCFPHTAVIIIGSQTPRALSTTAAFSFLPGCISNRGGIAVCVCVCHESRVVMPGWPMTSHFGGLHCWLLACHFPQVAQLVKTFIIINLLQLLFHSGSFPPPALLTCTCAFTILWLTIHCSLNVT